MANLLKVVPDNKTLRNTTFNTHLSVRDSPRVSEAQRKRHPQWMLHFSKTPLCYTYCNFLSFLVMLFVIGATLLFVDFLSISHCKEVIGPPHHQYSYVEALTPSTSNNTLLGGKPLQKLKGVC